MEYLALFLLVLDRYYEEKIVGLEACLVYWRNDAYKSVFGLYSGALLIPGILCSWVWCCEVVPLQFRNLFVRCASRFLFSVFSYINISFQSASESETVSTWPLLYNTSIVFIVQKRVGIIMLEGWKFLSYMLKRSVFPVATWFWDFLKRRKRLSEWEFLGLYI